MSPLKVLAASAAILLCASGARAGPCGRPDLVESWPADGDIGVPRNAKLAARYAASAEYAAEEVALEHVGSGEEPVTASFDASETLLSIEPKTPLVAGDAYVVRWPPLRGITTAGFGEGAVVHFTAGTSADTDAPVFPGVAGVSWDLERFTDECTDASEDRYLFDLALGEATDDGGRGMLTLVVFQTSGSRIDLSGAPEEVLVRRFPEGKPSVEVHRPIDAAIGKVCFGALVRDALGRISSSADRETCTTTVKPPFFYGCAVAASRPVEDGQGRLALALVFGLVMVSALLRRRRTPVRIAAFMLALSAVGFREGAARAEDSLPDRAPAEGVAASRLRVAVRAEPTFGVGSGSFYNQLVGARADFRFTDKLSLGPYLGYANLQGHDGRASNVLALLELEYRPMLAGGSRFGLPLRWATGYLPKNGPLMRLAAGISYAASPHVDFVLDAFAPTFWVVRNRTVASLGAALEVSYAP